MEEHELLKRTLISPRIFGGKPVIGGYRLAVEHVLDLLAADDSAKAILAYYPFLGPEDIRACLVFARRVVAGELALPPLTVEG